MFSSVVESVVVCRLYTAVNDFGVSRGFDTHEEMSAINSVGYLFSSSSEGKRLDDMQSVFWI